MTDGSVVPLVVNGWTLFAHPLFLDQVAELAEKVTALKAANPAGYRGKNATKRLAAITRLILAEIPCDPANPKFRQGNTLGDEHRHWFRAKFFQQYRLFFRFHAESRIIIFTWVNDDTTLRAYDSRTDAYRVFKGMLEDGNPPGDWKALLAGVQKSTGQLAELMEQR
ncbi:MAG TPA: type II toxin-antitoxin system YhaV family toxin [Paracoccus sp. (in: a-proteobacteria)]|uniref:type II toxin-antitoxin system YhaV family toxin n=1 Tax=uncultured Paracoccus sp. TaxID=189685 RepID=UPI00262555CB|nr:type II toxin-antitoxin system YhaV family toxin [uncultured Paracoccus sp.]HMQ42281.1 type II toxin-antitoxin system YhaV family toxin [Paracoccus sp. (in: a-proteobacteria)]HMR36808.1 type II toxin-antitoxin system YhaV family toxin [Paracoccus sp. (in: a-proteobacteria)]